MKLSIQHEIRITLPAGIPRAVLHLLLTPRSGPGQTVQDWRLELPQVGGTTGFADGFGNWAVLVAQAKPAEEWLVTARGTVETVDRNGVLGRIPGEPVPRLYLRQTEATQPNPALVATMQSAGSSKDGIALLHKLMSETLAVLRIRPPSSRNSQGWSQSQGQSQGQSLVQTLTPPPTSARPSPPELAHAFVGCARALGIPARYVSGYLAVDTATAPAMHAWAEAHDDALGWIGFDPMLQLCPTDRHVRVACGLDATSTAPLRSVPAAVAVPSPKLTVQVVA